MFGKSVGRFVALVSVVGFLAVSAPASWAEPTEPGTTTEPAAPGPVRTSFTLATSDLGYGSALSFYGLQGVVQLTVPVPQGLTPAVLNATVQPPVNLRSGVIIVSQAEREFARVNVPTNDQAPIVIPLAGAEVVNDSVTVTLRAYLVPLDGYCVYPWSPLRLTNATVGYTGVEQPPTTVAHFLPPVLRKLTIFVPRSPSVAESDTTVQLAAATAAHYGQQAPEIAVVPLADGQTAPPTPPRPQERQIVVKEGPDSGLSLQGATDLPWLVISGPLGSAAEPDMALLFGNLSQLAVASKVVAGTLKFSPRLPDDVATLRELGQPGLNSVALQPRLSIALDQTRFGRSIHAVRVHLKGSYSPLPNTGGQIQATVGTETIDSWPADGHGAIDRWIDIPDRLLQRWTGLDVTLDVAGNVGRCGDFYTAGAGDHMFTLTINGDSTVQSSPATPPVPDGLRSVPQALMPQIQVGIEPRSFDDTARAARIVVGLQRISSIPIVTTVVSAQQAIDSSKPAIVIAADGWKHSDIPLPVAAESSGRITVNALQSDGKPATLTLDPELRFATLQTVVNRGRTLLVATSNGATAQLDVLLKWLDSDAKRWQGLRGVALVSVPGEDPVVVDRPDVATAAPSATFEGPWGSKWLWWFGGAWLAVAVIGAAVILLRSRRRSRHG
ncbi:hypothetical protein KXD96_04940 [Mycobacterium sp. SMC-2]|uniref:hypothetical protein n=1 Tax=Mycobacterium sp. SMC-2 TaxID=2857058 RepID=UPI0021B3E08E|nr:hypothetical protein [Mycobacterium sp. SMC-2]UXA07480.1 hypothetical protein KXD96_04940 [Mycobacterium sp. SMC-2]